MAIMITQGQSIATAPSLPALSGAALSRELVRYATLAPSSHNTQ